MNKLSIAVNTYLSSKKIFEEQIKKQTDYITEYNLKINELMKDKMCILHLKANGHYSYLDNCHEAISQHKANIERLKKGDIAFLFELMLKEEKQKHDLISGQIIKLIDAIEEDIVNRHKPEWFKPESMSMEEFIESGKVHRQKLRSYISRLLDDDFELYKELEKDSEGRER